MKNTIIAGGRGSGKTTLAKELASKFLPQEVVSISARLEDFSTNAFCFGCCTKHTKLIIIEELKDLSDMAILFRFISADELAINKQSHAIFYIKPAFILTFQCVISLIELKKELYKITTWFKNWNIISLPLNIAKAKPVLFKTEMVRAIDSYKKNRTRRTSGLEEVNKNPDWYWASGVAVNKNGKFHQKLLSAKGNQIAICKFGQVGDILWIKETFYAYGHWTTFTENGKSKKKFMDLTKDNCYCHQYHADWQPKEPKKFGQLGWHKRPALFMPKSIAKTFLKITRITCERLQDITQEGAIHEGIFDYNNGTYKNYFTQKGLRDEDGVECLLPIASFQSLWCSINGLKNWDENPWVWVIEFEKVKYYEQQG